MNHGFGLLFPIEYDTFGSFNSWVWESFLVKVIQVRVKGHGRFNLIGFYQIRFFRPMFILNVVTPLVLKLFCMTFW
jgi:hypothetical protein